MFVHNFEQEAQLSPRNDKICTRFTVTVWWDQSGKQDKVYVAILLLTAVVKEF